LQVKQLAASRDLYIASMELSQIKAYNAKRTGRATPEEDKASFDSLVVQGAASAAKAQAELEQMDRTQADKLNQARSRVAQARADLAQLQFLYDNCQIKAPITGAILKKSAEAGNYVNPGAFSGAGGISVSLCDMANLADLEIDLSIQERDISKVVEKQTCMVMPEAFQAHKPFLDKYPKGYPAAVSRIMPTADRGKGTISVRVKPIVPEAEAGVYLKPDMGVIVSFKKK
jgi:multidrug efflux pump subunit AcrA (membrane-fusion protein)